MKRLSRALLLAIGLVVLFRPLVPLAQELPLEKVSSGKYTIQYAGQTFRVSSTVAVKIKFEMISPIEVRLTFISDSGLPGTVSVFWVEFDKYVFQGPIPTVVPWEGILNTEGGFIDR